MSKKYWSTALAALTTCGVAITTNIAIITSPLATDAGLSLTRPHARYQRLQLKHNGKFLDASYCTDKPKLVERSDYDNGSCQQWELVPNGDGYYRMKLKYNGKFLDASYCTDELKLTGRSDYNNGSCQLWSVEPNGDGYFKLQLKYNGKYLDASYCTDELKLTGRSDYDNGSCQLWKFVP
jgi:Ricin-type beta-trefoil lectin domain-like